MSEIQNFKSLPEFLSHFASSKHKDLPYTHTKIPDKEKGTYGGKYSIPDDQMTTFYKLYYEHVWEKKRKEHLTEVQLKNNGPIAIDFDFRYDFNEIKERQHSFEHIQDMVLLYLEVLKEIFIFDESKPFNIFIMEKPQVNCIEEEQVTKDGIHMIINIATNHTIQQIVRDIMIRRLPEIWDIPITNTWDKVLDEGISKGCTNWQLIGSCKPRHDTYAVTHFYTIQYNKTDDVFDMTQNSHNINMKEHITELSVRNGSHPCFDLTSFAKTKCDEMQNIQKPKTKIRIRNVSNVMFNQTDSKNMFGHIQNEEQLADAVDDMLDELNSSEFKIKEIHYYTLLLSEEYYAPGSHRLNRLVAFALKQTDERLFLTWVTLRSKASDFDFNSISELYNQWINYFNKEGNTNSVTSASIRYWAKQSNPEEYEKIKKTSIDYYIEESIQSSTEYDFANVLFHMHRGTYVCVNFSIKGGEWYQFNGNRWIKDDGLTLRQCISTQMYELYAKKQDEVLQEFNDKNVSDERNEQLGKRSKQLYGIKAKLKKTSDKNNILREAAELFYDPLFLRIKDENPYLLCFNNGVVDFKQNKFRPGKPEDYITKCTNIDYTPYNPQHKICGDIEEFMYKLFPSEELRVYMWNHLGSVLIGTTVNHAFTIYYGGGCNGKSILTELMSRMLGEYKGTVPITLVTEKRGLIGGTSDEVLKLKAVRYAVMQEPSKGIKLNEGVMKELTAGDPLQVRGLYKESEVFYPQFTLVMCCNELPEVSSMDEGTWRRIREVDFVSRFVDDLPEDYVEGDGQSIYLKDKMLKEKFTEWAPIFAGMLVNYAFENKGIVNDCPTVLKASNTYRAHQDYINTFISEKIVQTKISNDKITKRELMREVNLWFLEELNNERKPPKTKDIYDCVSKKFGTCGSKGWSGITFAREQHTDSSQNHL